MSNRIDSSSSQPTRWPDPDPKTQAPSARPPAARALDDLPDASAAAVARAARAVTHGPSAAPLPHPTIAMGVDVVGRAYAPICKRLDDFMESARPTFHTPEGDAKVALPFRMLFSGPLPATPRPSDSPFVVTACRVRANQAALQQVATRVGLNTEAVNRIVSGRGTPAEIRKLTQGLIDAGRLPPPNGRDSVGQRIRQMMTDHGLGLDCAGYSQQAFLASRGLSRSQTHLAPILGENLANLDAKGFRRIPVDDAMPGDLFTMLPLNPHDPNSTGHTTIVRDARYASPSEIAAYREHGAPGFGRGHVTMFTLDSSWGSGGNAQVGGVDRRVLLHDESSGQWAQVAGVTARPTNGPYDHALDGVYRPKGEP
jgi:hypothetical protein